MPGEQSGPGRAELRGMQNSRLPLNTDVRVRLRTRRGRRGCAGFSLLETVMAVALLAVVMMSLAGGISQSIHLESFSKQSNAAFLLANAQIEAIRTALQTNPTATSFTDADGSTVRLTVTSPQIVDRQDNIDFSLPVPSGYEKLVTLNSSAQTSGQ